MEYRTRKSPPMTTNKALEVAQHHSNMQDQQSLNWDDLEADIAQALQSERAMSERLADVVEMFNDVITAYKVNGLMGGLNTAPVTEALAAYAKHKTN